MPSAWTSSVGTAVRVTPQAEVRCSGHILGPDGAGAGRGGQRPSDTEPSTVHGTDQGHGHDRSAPGPVSGGQSSSVRGKRGERLCVTCAVARVACGAVPVEAQDGGVVSRRLAAVGVGDRADQRAHHFAGVFGSGVTEAGQVDGARLVAPLGQHSQSVDVCTRPPMGACASGRPRAFVCPVSPLLVRWRSLYAVNCTRLPWSSLRCPV